MVNLGSYSEIIANLESSFWSLYANVMKILLFPICAILFLKHREKIYELVL